MVIEMKIVEERSRKLKKKLEYKIPGYIQPEFDNAVYESMLSSLFKWFVGKSMFIQPDSKCGADFLQAFKKMGAIPTFEQLLEGGNARHWDKSVACQINGDDKVILYQINLIR